MDSRVRNRERVLRRIVMICFATRLSASTAVVQETRSPERDRSTWPVYVILCTESRPWRIKSWKLSTLYCCPAVHAYNTVRVFHHYCVCVLSTHRHPAHPASEPILHSRETQRTSAVVVKQRQRDTTLGKDRQSTSTSHRSSANDSRVPVILNDIPLSTKR